MVHCVQLRSLQRLLIEDADVSVICQCSKLRFDAVPFFSTTEISQVCLNVESWTKGLNIHYVWWHISNFLVAAREKVAWWGKSLQIKKKKKNEVHYG